MLNLLLKKYYNNNEENNDLFINFILQQQLEHCMHFGS